MNTIPITVDFKVSTLENIHVAFASNMGNVSFSVTDPMRVEFKARYKKKKKLYAGNGGSVGQIISNDML